MYEGVKLAGLFEFYAQEWVNLDELFDPWSENYVGVQSKTFRHSSSLPRSQVNASLVCNLLN